MQPRMTRNRVLVSPDEVDKKRSASYKLKRLQFDRKLEVLKTYEFCLRRSLILADSRINGTLACGRGRSPYSSPMKRTIPMRSLLLGAQKCAKSTARL